MSIIKKTSIVAVYKHKKIKDLSFIGLNVHDIDKRIDLKIGGKHGLPLILKNKNSAFTTLKHDFMDRSSDIEANSFDGTKEDGYIYIGLPSAAKNNVKLCVRKENLESKIIDLFM